MLGTCWTAPSKGATIEELKCAVRAAVLPLNRLSDTLSVLDNYDSNARTNLLLTGDLKLYDLDRIQAVEV